MSETNIKESINTKVDLKIDATSFLGLSDYGFVLVGDKAFEFFDPKKESNFIVIPWNEIDHIAASVVTKKKYINRFVIFTKRNGKLAFSTKDNKKTLRAISQYIDSSKLVRSQSFMEVWKVGSASLWNKLMKKFKK